jgi:tRNA (Thr-GGU) A37 N-methylase
MCKIEIIPIGLIHSPYKQVEDIPNQGKLKPDVKAVSSSLRVRCLS